MNTTPYGFVSAFGVTEKTTVGSTYLYDDWKLATIQLKDAEIKNCAINVDLKNSLIEINTDKGIKVLQTHRVEKLIVGFELGNQQVLQSAKNFDGSQAGLRGLVEVLAEHNNIKLLKHYYSEVKEGAYNATLDMGNNETKYLVKSKFFFFSNGKLFEVPTRKKKLLDQVSEGSRIRLEGFLDERKIKLKDQDDLVVLCEFLNNEGITITKS